MQHLVKMPENKQNRIDYFQIVKKRVLLDERGRQWEGCLLIVEWMTDTTDTILKKSVHSFNR